MPRPAHAILAAVLFPHALFGFQSASGPIPGGLDPAAYPIVEGVCRGLVDQGHAPGAVILIGRADEMLMRKSYGFRREPSAAEAMTVDTLFDLASVTKATCTSAAAMLLVQDGKLSLDDPVAKFVPEFRGASKDDITIRHLLTHTSGLPAYTSAAALQRDYGPAPNPDGLLKRIGETAKTYETGRGYTYSCLNYLTLARIVHNETGGNMDAFLRERIWEPLGMKDTTFYPSTAQIARTAPTIKNETELRRGLVHDPLARYSVCEGYAPGNAGAFSTADDMSRYVRMLLGGGELNGVRVLSREVVEVMTTDQAPRSVARRTCGWGVYTSPGYSTSLNQKPETLCIGHTGYTGTMVWMDKLSKAYVILLTNCVYPDDQSEHREAIGVARREIVSTVLDHLDLYREVRKKR